MGSFYLDPYRREIKSRRNLTGTVLEQSDTTPYPLVFLSCNMRPPVWDHMPTDVTFDDALALFHEFGHALHFVLARDQVGGALGAQKIPLDMEEVVPQFMEHWLYQDSVLQSLAHLSQSDGRIPAEIIEKLKQQRSERKAHEILHSIFMSELELDVFSSDSEESVVAIQRKVADAYMPHEPFPKSDISPLMDIMESNSSGKPVAHYRYLWSEVMSADLFDIFEQAGLANEAEVKRLGRLFRETVLDPGATLDTKESFRKLRGRDMAPDTLLKMYRF